MTNFTVASAFVRDRFTWLMYLMLGLFAYYQSGLGPVMPFLGAELEINYTVVGLHFSAFAVGAIVAGLFADRWARRWGRRRMFWSGAVGLALGALALATSRVAALTIASALVMGLSGNLVLVLLQAALSDHHGRWRATALTEANVAAGVASAVAPLALGILYQAQLGWRWALILVAVVILIVSAANWRKPFVEASTPAAAGPGQGASRRRLPSIFWLYWLVLVLIVSTEWCLIYWSAAFLENVVGLPTVVAATLMTVFWLAYVVGRLAGSRLTRRISASRLLISALVFSLASFPLLWLARTPLVNVAGLFLVGLGLANLFPLALSVAVGVAADQANAASARLILGLGLAMLILPLVLGGAADQVGLSNAFGVIAILLLLAIAGVSYAARRQPAPAANESPASSTSPS